MLSDSIVFSSLDLVSGYWQVPLDQDACEKSAFCNARLAMAVEGFNFWPDLCSPKVRRTNVKGAEGTTVADHVTVIG